MRKTQIPKKNGTFRTIYIPSTAEKTTLRSIVGHLNKRSVDKPYIHGFVPGKSPVTNAMEHIGYKYTTCFDLKDFFDTVTEARLSGKLSNDILNQVLVDGAARQGLPTSPAVANIAAQTIDEAILRFIKKNKLSVVYTRYADDLSFSYNDESVTEILLKRIPEIVTMNGFRINREKTRTQKESCGRRGITGVMVDAYGVYTSRKDKRRLRAAIHQKTNSVAGLTEWNKLKLPKPYNPDKSDHFTRIEECKKLQYMWNVKFPLDQFLYKGPDIQLTDDCIITGDPVYTLGMSTFTDGWSSCFKWPGGCNRKTTIGYCMLPNTKVALMLHPIRTVTIGGVTRRAIIQRAILYCFDDKMYYSVFYGNDSQLERILEENGIKSRCYNLSDGRRELGVIPSKYFTWYTAGLYIQNVQSKNSSGRMIKVTIRG